MKSIVFGLSLVSAAVAQISVVGMSMVPVGNGAAAAAEATSTTAYGVAAPSTVTPAPTAGVYDKMPYAAYQAGGYKSLDCGYGYSKQSDGSCKPLSWVSRECFFFRTLLIRL